MICEGDGTCISDSKTSCPYNCKPKKCLNYGILCESKLPQFEFTRYLGCCLECITDWGKLNITENKEECPVCYESHSEKVMYGCGHAVCSKCFTQNCKQVFPNYNFPPFPFENLRSTYEHGSVAASDPRLIVILQWQEVCDRMEMEYNDSRNLPRNPVLKRCPICRFEIVPPWMNGKKIKK